jgi:HEAT repeat protein
LRLFIFTLACLSLSLLVQDAIAQQASGDTERAAFIHSLIEKQRARLSSSSAEERLDAVVQLRGLNTSESSRVAAIALNDSSLIVRATATHAILSLPSDEAAALLLPLLNDKSELVREETAFALGRTKSLIANRKLSETISNKKERTSVRCAAVVSLGLIGDGSSAPLLIQILQNKKEKNEFLIRATAHSLGQLQSREAVPLLIALLSNEKMSADIRREAAFALGLIGDSSANSALQTALNSGEAYLSHIAEEALKEIKSKQ